LAGKGTVPTRWSGRKAEGIYDPEVPGTTAKATGCEAAKSGQYQVVVSIPRLRDGSWRRLTDIANYHELPFEVVVWARNFDLREWAEALDNGAFDVVDAVYDQPRVVEAAKCALWAAYLKGALPNSRRIRPHHAA
jgi:DNA-binding NtrC family response regulator